MQHAAAATLFILLAVAMTWPLAFAIDRAVAVPGDPFINTWILDWVQWALLHRPHELFHANIFHPARYSLAFSENLFGVAVLLIPLHLAGVSPLAVHNVAIIAGFAFCGFGAYLLGWYVTRSFFASVAAGIFYAFLPFRFTHLPHVQHVWHGWLPLMLLALLACRDRPTWRRAVLFGAAFLMNGATNIHTLLFGGFACGVTSLVLFARRPRELMRIGLAGAVALLLLAPLLYPYRAVAKSYGMKRTWNESEMYSAELRDWLEPGVYTRFYRRWVDRDVDPERWLFPGVLGIAFGGAGFLAGVAPRWRRRAGQDAGAPEGVAVGAAFLWIVIGVLGSLGLHTFFHRFLFSWVPGFRAIRVPARWAIVAYVGIALLVAIGLAVVERRQKVVAALVATLFLIELRAAPIRWYPIAAGAPQVYRWLARSEVGGAIVELPMEPDLEYLYMLRATEHHKPLVNGVSGFVPPDYAALDALEGESPISDRFVDELQRAGTELLIVHADMLGSRSADFRDWLRRELDRGRLTFVRRFDSGISGAWVFSLGGGPQPRPEELERFLRGEQTYGNGTIGVLDSPHPGEWINPRSIFSGWALSPYGIRKVDLLFDSGQIRLPTTLIDDPGVKRVFPWYPATPRPRFVARFPTRPPGIDRETNVQVEITDGRGERTLLEGRWIDWP